MPDLSLSELALVAIVAIIAIGPKELPSALAQVGRWMGKARRIMASFRSGFDDMVREAELQEMEKKWADENARIMREYPAVEAGVTGEGVEMEPLDGPPVSHDADVSTENTTSDLASPENAPTETAKKS